MVRLGLWLLAIFHLALWGVPAVIAPRWFFDHFPGLGHRWTAAYQPYNDHLMTDVGAAAIAFGVLLVIAALLDDRKVTTAALVAVTTFSALHLGYHSVRHGSLHGKELALSLISLVIGVLVPLGLLLLVTLSARAARQDQN